MHRLVVVFFVVFFCLSYANPCRDLASCCKVFDFTAPAGHNAQPFTTDTVAVPSGNNSLWWPNGISLTEDHGYSLGLFNSSRIPHLQIYASSADLTSPTQRLVLSAFQVFDTSLLRGTQGINFYTFKQPSCIATVTTLHTATATYHQSLTMTTFRNGVRVETYDKPYVSNQPIEDSHDFSSLNVDKLSVYLYGTGYGALASVEVCYHSPQGYDACDECGGNGVGCATPGQSCNTGLSGVCQFGTYNFDLDCIPNSSNMPELCNGIDDNCNGIVDEGDFGSWTCGVGECERTIPQCQNGTMMPNSACVPGQSSEEVCDGKDNNCNGQVDEGGVCVSPSPAPSASPSPIPSPSVSSAPVAPYLMPILDCVTMIGAGIYEARFGYTLIGPGAVEVEIPEGAANTLKQGGVVISGQTTRFLPGTAVKDAFSVQFAADETVLWTVNLPGQPSQLAVASAGSYICGSDSAMTFEAVQPIFQGCTTMIGGRCTVNLSYYNRNQQTVQIDAGVGSNWFSPAPEDRRQPRVFFPNLRQNVETVEFDCSMPSWVLNWTLVLGTQQRSAQATAATVCT
jgi:hypothetical protein